MIPPARWASASASRHPDFGQKIFPPQGTHRQASRQESSDRRHCRTIRGGSVGVILGTRAIRQSRRACLPTMMPDKTISTGDAPGNSGASLCFYPAAREQEKRKPFSRRFRAAATRPEYRTGLCVSSECRRSPAASKLMSVSPLERFNFEKGETRGGSTAPPGQK